jgi:hypothetical protein
MTGQNGGGLGESGEPVHNKSLGMCGTFCCDCGLDVDALHDTERKP